MTTVLLVRSTVQIWFCDVDGMKTKLATLRPVRLHDRARNDEELQFGGEGVKVIRLERRR